MYPKITINFLLVVQLFETNFSMNNGFLWCGKILNTAISDHRYYFTSSRFFRSFLPEVCQNKIRNYRISLFSARIRVLAIPYFLFKIIPSQSLSRSFLSRLGFLLPVVNPAVRRYPRRRKYSHSAQAATLPRLLTSFCELKTISRFQV